MVFQNTIGLLNDKAYFNGTLNGIGTYFSTINQTSVVFSMVFQNTIGLLNDKTCFNGTLNGIGTYFSTINQTSVVFSMVFQNTVQCHWTTQ